MVNSIIEIIKNIFSVLGFWFSPSLREKKDKEKNWNDFKKLEDEYINALANGQPSIAAIIDQRMREMRQKYKYLNG